MYRFVPLAVNESPPSSALVGFEGSSSVSANAPSLFEARPGSTAYFISSDANPAIRAVTSEL